MTVLLVIFIVVMLLWFLALAGARAYPAIAPALGWLPFIAVLVLFLLVHGIRT